MLTIVVPGPMELYDEDTREFLEDEAGAVTLKLEHSLISLSKWESRFEKPFLGHEEKSPEEKLFYIQSMDMARNTPDEVYERLSKGNLDDIEKYVNAKMTATWFHEPPGAPKSRDVITNELIYYWMFSYGIPLECEKWHLNRLFTLIRVFSASAAKPEKMKRGEVIARQREINEQRKKQLGTTG